MVQGLIFLAFQFIHHRQSLGVQSAWRDVVFFGWEGMLPAELIASVGVSGTSGGWLGISFLSGM